VSHSRQAQARHRPRFPQNREFFAIEPGICEQRISEQRICGQRICRGACAAAQRLQAGDAAPQLATQRTQRFTRPPREAQPFAWRNLAAADGRKRLPARRGNFCRRTHPGEIDAEPLARIRSASRRQDEAQHRPEQIAFAPDERGEDAGPRLAQQQPERAAARVADAARPALRIAGMPLREAALRVPGRVPLGVSRARTRGRRNRIRINHLKSLDSGLRKQRGTYGMQIGGDIQHWRGPRMGRGYRSHFVLMVGSIKSGCKKSGGRRDRRTLRCQRSVRAMFVVFFPRAAEGRFCPEAVIGRLPALTKTGCR